MTITRRNLLLGATATAALLPIAARAQTSEVVIGVIYPLSGASAQIGVDAQKAFETAADIINKNYDFELPLAKGEGLGGLGHRQPNLRALPDTLHLGRQFLAEPASPRPQILFPRSTA